jgi:hypothetical protein
LFDSGSSKEILIACSSGKLAHFAKLADGDNEDTVETETLMSKPAIEEVNSRMIATVETSFHAVAACFHAPYRERFVDYEDARANKTDSSSDMLSTVIQILGSTPIMSTTMQCAMRSLQNGVSIPSLIRYIVWLYSRCVSRALVSTSMEGVFFA